MVVGRTGICGGAVVAFSNAFLLVVLVDSHFGICGGAVVAPSNAFMCVVLVDSSFKT